MDVDNPFSRDAIDAVSLGPFSKTVRPAPDISISQGMGFTPDEVRRQLEKVPGFAETLDRPEADALRHYLQGSQDYDMSVLNRLVLELTDEVAKAGRPSRAREAAGASAGPPPVRIPGVSPLLNEEPESGLTVRDTGPWWLSER